MSGGGGDKRIHFRSKINKKNTFCGIEIKPHFNIVERGDSEAIEKIAAKTGKHSDWLMCMRCGSSLDLIK